MPLADVALSAHGLLLGITDKDAARRMTQADNGALHGVWELKFCRTPISLVQFHSRLSPFAGSTLMRFGSIVLGGLNAAGKPYAPRRNGLTLCGCVHLSVYRTACITADAPSSSRNSSTLRRTLGGGRSVTPDFTFPFDTGAHGQPFHVRLSSSPLLSSLRLFFPAMLAPSLCLASQIAEEPRNPSGEAIHARVLATAAADGTRPLNKDLGALME